MKRIYIIILCILLSVIVASNNLSLVAIQTYQFSSTNDKFQFLLAPSKGRGENKLIEDFSEWKKESPKRTGLKLYRNFSKNYLMFLRWKEYNKSLYGYPYKKPQ